jgi:enamine deaminase RidA (YjgF/YER057c/UK114 family)
MERQNISSGGKWEDQVGYSRAVKKGNMIFVAGTTAHTGTEIIGKNDAYAQAVYILQKIENAIIEADGKMSDIVSTRIYVTDIKNWEAIGRAHGEFFKTIKPAATLVEISSLIEKDLLVEIEAIAMIN